MDAQTLYLAALVSQATFALSLTLLAWSDRRTKGTAWLAAACAIQFFWTATLTSGRSNASSAAQTAGAELLIILFSMVYMGFRWFAVRKPLRNKVGPSVVAASLLIVAIVSIYHPLLAQNLGRICALFIGINIVVTLWTTRIPALRVAARSSAVIIVLVLGLMTIRLIANQPVERWRADTPEALLIIHLREITVVLVTLLSFSFIGVFVAETNRRLHDETRIDMLTGLRNRRAMEECAIREVRNAALHKQPLALLMLDMDRFKDLNDTWGHSQGDRALRSLGAILMTAAGPRDVTARMGGEEFAVLLPNSSLEAAAERAERLRLMIAELRLNEGDHMLSFTVSIGVSMLHEGEQGWADMLCRADDALYQAKRDGRNRVSICANESAIFSADREARHREFRSKSWLPKPGPML